jgi:excisionase family DNA binding protein
MPILDLATHSAYYVTVSELAEYWAVNRQQIQKRIQSGSLDAIRLGARSYRVRTQAALEFERTSTVASVPAATPAREPLVDASKLAHRNGLRRITGGKNDG